MICANVLRCRQALFTDSFRISARGGPQNGIPLINSSNIAWETDTQYRFQNAENWNSDENRQIYEFLNETFAAVPDKLSTEVCRRPDCLMIMSACVLKHAMLHTSCHNTVWRANTSMFG